MTRVSRCLSFIFSCLLGLAIYNTAKAEIPPPRAVSSDALQAALTKDVRSEVLPGGYILAVPEPFAAPIPATDPVYQFRCNRALYVYEREQAQGVMTRRVTIHFESDNADAAARSARLIARILRLHREHFGRESVFGRGSKTCDVWFVPTTPKTVTEGGETRDANVYIFAANEITTPLELVRTVAHEWGHLTLPAARGYAEPESDAAGYLGERLYLDWLYRDATMGDSKQPRPDDGTTAENLRLYYQRQVEPLMERWQAGGPNNPVLNEDRTEAMDYYIGAVLDYDRAFSSKVVGNALYGIVDESARDFLTSLKEVVAGEIDRGMYANLPAWIPFKTGGHAAMGISGGGDLALKGPKTLTVSLGGSKTVKPGAARDTNFRVTAPGWYKASAASGSLTQITLKSGTK